MRRMLPLLLVILVPVTAAHGDVEHGQADVVGFLPPGEDLDHIRLAEVTLGPEERGNYTLSFSGQPFQEDWHWLLRANVEQGVVQFRIFQEGIDIPLRVFTWGGVHVESLQLPTTGTMRLELRNMAPDGGNSTVQFYYDQTCNCQFKRVPLPNGPVWFNIPADEGDRVSWEFTVQPIQVTGTTGATPPEQVQVRARYLVEDPDDILGAFIPRASESQVLNASDPPCHEPTAQWNGCIDLSFTAEHSGQQLVWLDITHEGDPNWSYMIRPLVDVEDPVQEAPLPPLLPVLALVGALVARRLR